MTAPAEAAADPSGWPDPTLAIAVFAVDPANTGLRLRGPAGPARDALLGTLRDLLPDGAPVRTVPSGITDDRLLGGLDLPATIATGRRVAARGVLSEADGGVVLLSMAERLTPSRAGVLAAVLDTGDVTLERDGLARRTPSRVGVVALDEGLGDDEAPPASLTDRLALLLHLDAVPPPCPDDTDIAVEAARARLDGVTAPDAVVGALCRTAIAAGIASVRAPLLTLRVARAIAALAGRGTITDADAAAASRLVLAPRATRLPEAPPAPPPELPEPADQHAGAQDGDAEAERQDAPPAPADAGAADTPPGRPAPTGETEAAGDATDIDAIVLAAVRAALPTRLLAPGAPATALPSAGSGAGGRVTARTALRRDTATAGRLLGAKRGDPARGRLHVLETVRAALPWQVLRRAEAASAAAAAVCAFPPSATLEAGVPAAPGVRAPATLLIRREDFRLQRVAPRLRLTTIFAVDASGSSARQRLAEAKGGVELLLAECYARRDRVALIAFRGRDGAVVLPPTGSMVRARRALSGLPGGGGTPLAAGLDAALDLAERLRRGGELSLLVVMTDGRANVARDGTADRDRAVADALGSARRARLARLPVLLIDIGTRPDPRAAAIADAMAARYLPLPRADAAMLAGAVRAAMPSA